jgi:hypothetical protein
MRALHRFLLVAPAALFVTLGACGKKKVLPAVMIGRYERQETSPLGILVSTAHLYLTPTGISPAVDDLIVTKRWGMRDKDVIDIRLLEGLKRQREG